MTTEDDADDVMDFIAFGKGLAENIENATAPISGNDASTPPPVYAPPKEAHENCKLCEDHFFSVKVQRSGKSQYICTLDDKEADLWLNNMMIVTEEDLEYVREKLQTHGDLVLSRWSKWSKDKRGALLSDTSAAGMFGKWPTASLPRWNPSKHRSSNGSYSRSEQEQYLKRLSDIGICPCIPWVEVNTFAADRMKLLSLLHGRAAFPPAEWAAFDTRESKHGFGTRGDPSHFYNGSGVIMCGQEYGRLVTFDTDHAHSWAVVGWPRAATTFNAQHGIGIMLRSAVDKIIDNAAPSGCSKWTHMICGGLRSTLDDTLWSSYHHQAFTTPVRFDSGVLLEKARNKLSLVLDEIELMQTSPDLMRGYAREHKAGMMFGSSASAEQQWKSVAASVVGHSTNQVAIWNRMVTECENVHAVFTMSDSMIQPGYSMSKEASTAMKTFGLTVKSCLKRQGEEVLRVLYNSKVFKSAFTKYTEVHPGNMWHRLTKGRNPNNQCDRLVWALTFLLDSIKNNSLHGSPWGTPYALECLTRELPSMACDNSFDSHLSTIALLDEFHGLWCFSQLSVLDDPCETEAIIGSVGRTDMLQPDNTFDPVRTSAAWPFKQALGMEDDVSRLLQDLCEAPSSKGSKGLSALQKDVKNRELLKDFWESARQAWQRQQASWGAAESFYEGMIAQISFDQSPEYLEETRAEREQMDVEHRWEEEARRQRGLPNFVQQEWSNGAGEDRVSRRKITKKKAAQDATEEEPDIQGLTLGDAQPNEDELRVSKDAQPERIEVKRDSLGVFDEMFRTDVHSSKGGVRWQLFVHALEDAGMVATRNGGSAVTFANAEGSIAFHKPHPEPVIDPIRLQQFMGKRLKRKFGWTPERFVLREKNAGQDDGQA